VDAIQVADDSMYRSGTKLVWVLVIVLTQVVGAIIHFAIGRPGGPRPRVRRPLPRLLLLLRLPPPDEPPSKDAKLVGRPYTRGVGKEGEDP
jgi:Phospholipase_D-nuclease N-terminal